MLKINEWEMVYMKKIQMDKSQIEKRLVKGGVVLLAMSGILLVAARTIDGFADWYSRVIYPVCVNTLGRVIFFSVGNSFISASGGCFVLDNKKCFFVLCR